MISATREFCTLSVHLVQTICFRLHPTYCSPSHFFSDLSQSVSLHTWVGNDCSVSSVDVFPVLHLEMLEVQRAFSIQPSEVLLGPDGFPLTATWTDGTLFTYYNCEPREYKLESEVFRTPASCACESLDELGR